MGATTGISWTDATWNPIRGCSRVSEGCRHCYAETVAARFSGPAQPYEGLVDKHGRWNGRIRVVEEHMHDPLRWQRPRKIFVNSMSDLFHENIPDDVIDLIFAVMAAARRHTFQVLTKRPARMHDYFARTSNGAQRSGHVQSSLDGLRTTRRDTPKYLPGWPLPNVWLGVSTEDQPTLDERVQQLLETSAAVHWISAEPLLGSLHLERFLVPAMHVTWGNTDLPPAQRERPTAEDVRAVAQLGRAAARMRGAAFLDWVVIGGESGPGHREMDVAWAQAIADQCQTAGVPVWMKQDSGPRAGEQRRLPHALWALKQFPAGGS